jgi:hypothetical protein
MGSPLGPLFANAFMIHFENEHVRPACERFGIDTWLRYVDDVFCIISKEASVDDVVQYLSSRHRSMKFTCERSTSGSLHFLDVTVNESPSGKYSTDLYVKPTNCGLYTLFDSFVPVKYKRCVIATLVHRSWVICQNYQLWASQITRLQNIFAQLVFPRDFIANCIKSFLQRKYTPRRSGRIASDTEETAEQIGLQFFLCLPYVGGACERLRLNIIETIKECSPRSHVQIVFRAALRIRDLFVVKDKTPNKLLSMVVYQVQCLSCNARYVGKTIRHIEVRLNEHKKSIGLPPQSQSYIARHVLSTGHTVDYENFKILARAPTDYKLRIKESLIIKEHSPELNNNETSVQLNLY